MLRWIAGRLYVASESTRKVGYLSKMPSLMHLSAAAAGVARDLYGLIRTRAAVWRVLEAVVGGICGVFEGFGVEGARGRVDVEVTEAEAQERFERTDQATARVNLEE